MMVLNTCTIIIFKEELLQFQRRAASMIYLFIICILSGGIFRYGDEIEDTANQVCLSEYQITVTIAMMSGRNIYNKIVSSFTSIQDLMRSTELIKHHINQLIFENEILSPHYRLYDINENSCSLNFIGIALAKIPILLKKNFRSIYA